MSKATITQQWLKYYEEETKLLQEVSTNFSMGVFLPHSQRKKRQDRLAIVQRQLLTVGAKITEEQFEEDIEPIVCYSWEEFREDIDFQNRK